jgi:hypothetical protein
MRRFRIRREQQSEGAQNPQRTSEDFRVLVHFNRGTSNRDFNLDFLDVPRLKNVPRLETSKVSRDVLCSASCRKMPEKMSILSLGTFISRGTSKNPPVHS